MAGFAGATGGAAKIARLMKESAAKCFYEAVVKAPIVEEALFRAAPSDLLIPKSDKSQRWDIGTIASLGFGLAHNFDRGEDGKLVFRKSLPLTQTLGSAFQWYLMRKRGYSHTTFAHMLHNALVTIVLYLGRNKIQ